MAWRCRGGVLLLVLVSASLLLQVQVRCSHGWESLPVPADDESDEFGPLDPYPLGPDHPSAADHHLMHARHKPLLPLDLTDVVGLCLASIGLIIAASGGIGGGGILVPIYILVMGFRTKTAIPLSNITILGSSIMNVWLNMPKKHPSANRPLVDWDLILVMEPLTIAGALVGSFLNKILPEWLLIIALVVLLGVTAHRTLEKGFVKYARESKAHQAALNKESELSKLVREQEAGDESAPLLDDEGRTAKGEFPDAIPMAPELEQILLEESKTPLDKLRGLCFVLFVVMSLNLLKGGGAFSPLGIECGSAEFWIITFSILGWVVGVSLYVRQYLVKRWETKRRVGYKYVVGDVEWNGRNTILYPSMCAFAGFFAGLFGVGGGIVKGPLMLEMGVDPQVASATSAVMIFFTSLTATTSFIAFGLLRWDYAPPLFLAGLIMTAVGQIGVGILIKKYNRTSYIILSIGAVVALSTVLMGLQSVFAMLTASEDDGSSVCSTGE